MCIRDRFRHAIDEKGFVPEIVAEANAKTKAMLDIMRTGAAPAPSDFLEYRSTFLNYLRRAVAQGGLKDVPDASHPVWNTFELNRDAIIKDMLGKSTQVPRQGLFEGFSDPVNPFKT